MRRIDMTRVAAILAGALWLASALAQSPPGPPSTDPPMGAVPPPSQTPPPPPAWEPRHGVEIKALDRINSRATTLTAKLNEPVQFHSLTITARACDVRPKDQDPDAAAFLEVTDANGAAPPFRAWLLVSAPAVSVFEHPLYDIRLVGCRP